MELKNRKAAALETSQIGPPNRTVSRIHNIDSDQSTNGLKGFNKTKNSGAVENEKQDSIFITIIIETK